MARIMGLQRKLLNRSLEAYIQSLETINRLSLVYRVETFTWLVCNAWELLLKARIIMMSGNAHAIYYPRRREEPVRTYSLRKCLDVVFPREDDPIRRNLLLVEELRDEATHLVIRQVPVDVLGLFQACVVNYHNSLNEWFGWSLSRRVSVGMMAIVYDVGPEEFDLSNRRLRRQLGKDTATYLLQFQARVQQQFVSLGRPTEFSVGIGYKLALTQKPGEADIVLTKGDIGDVTGVVEVPKDPSTTHPYRTKELVQAVNQAIGTSVVNAYDVQCVVRTFKVRKRSEYYYQGRVQGSPVQYSPKFADWLVEQHRRDNEFFVKQRTMAKVKSQQKRDVDTSAAEAAIKVAPPERKKLVPADMRV